MRKYLAGSSPNADKLTQIARANGVTVEWLATGEGPKERSSLEHATRSLEQPLVDYSLVPLYEVAASAGLGAPVEREEVQGELAFRSDWIRTSLNATKDDLRLLHVEGDSMDPELRRDDIILINRRDNTIRREAIYVIRVEDTLKVKKVQRLVDGTLRLISANPMYPAETIEPRAQSDPANFAIIGRVVWACRRL